MKLLIILLYCTSTVFITISTVSAQDNLLEIKNNISTHTFANKKTFIKIPIIQNIELKKRKLLEERKNVILLKSVKNTKNHQIHLEYFSYLDSEETSNNKTTIIMLILFIGGLLLFFGYIRHWKNRITKEKDSKENEIKKTS